MTIEGNISLRNNNSRRQIAFDMEFSFATFSKNEVVWFSDPTKVKNVVADLCVCPNQRLQQQLTNEILQTNNVGVGLSDLTYPNNVGVWFSDPNNVGILKKGWKTQPLPTLGNIIAFFKYNSTKEFNNLRNGNIIKLWQRNYYEHIIRNDKELYEIRNYIQNNPLKWALDEYYC